MQKRTMKPTTDFQDHLRQELKDPKFKKAYDEYGRQLDVAYKMLLLRKKAKISQAQLAKRMGTTQSNVARMESGDQNFTVETLDKIASSFGKELHVEFA